MKSILLLLSFMMVFAGCSNFKSMPAESQSAAGPQTDGHVDDPSDSDSGYSPDVISSVPQGLGVVVWSGLPNLSDLNFKRGMDFLFKEGFQTFRLVVAPQSPGIYKINPPCDGNRPDFLKCLVSNGEMERVLAHPRLKIANLVVYDTLTAGAAGDLRKYLNATFLNQNRTEVIRIYEELAFELANRFSNTGKKFVISDWEADNAIYCGSAYNFVTNPEITDPDDGSKKIRFREWCTSRYSAIYGGQALTPDQAMSGYRLWQSLRIEGIEKGRRRAGEYGAKNVVVQAGMEFATLRLLDPIQYPSTLDQVAAQLDFDVVTYSSYESINNGTLSADLSFLKSKLGPNKRLAVSEFGFSEANFGTSTRGKMKDVVNELVRRLDAKDIDYATAWQAFDDGSAAEFGLYSSASARTSRGEGFWDGIKANADGTLKATIDRAGGGCGGCDCGWAIGARLPAAE
ncbi:MAG: hypothetical protein K2X47_10765, partial [Bdellovibrionales bacterium]|nr:hypothetical protein [Bdellovibrionales bacterium]